MSHLRLVANATPILYRVRQLEINNPTILQRIFFCLGSFCVEHIASYVTEATRPKTDKKASKVGGLFVSSCFSNAKTYEYLKNEGIYIHKTKIGAVLVIRKPEVLAKKLGLTFDQPQLFIMALTHRSMGAKNNERLEYLGDSILGFVIAHKLYEMFPDAREGDLSRLRASLVNQTSLAELAKELNIGDYLILGSGELKSGGFRRNSILSDALEAIMGALVKDKGVGQSEEWILSIFSKKLAELDLNSSKKDPKTELQELMQSQKIELPVYELVKMTGAAHSQTFNIKCSTVIHNESCIGAGVSRKKAEQAAAEKMLKLLKAQKI